MSGLKQKGIANENGGSLWLVIFLQLNFKPRLTSESKIIIPPPFFRIWLVSNHLMFLSFHLFPSHFSPHFPGHFRVADSRLDLPEGWTKGAPCSLGISDQDVWEKLGEAQPVSWSLGVKRNVAIELAAGEIIAHFDDDDL